MHLLIDGYNLLHQSDLLGKSRGADWLEKARNRLFGALQKHLDPIQLVQTTIVFDRHSKKQIDADARLPSGIRVLYAVDYPEADDLIEVLIARHPHPKTLLVVSSDHRLQKAAKRRKAQCTDSDVWYDTLTTSKPRGTKVNIADEKPQAELSEDEVRRWLTDFKTDKTTDEPNDTKTKERPKNELEEEGYNPFPDGYAEDLLS